MRGKQIIQSMLNWFGICIWSSKQKDALNFFENNQLIIDEEIVDILSPFEEPTCIQIEVQEESNDNTNEYNEIITILKDNSLRINLASSINLFNKNAEFF